MSTKAKLTFACSAAFVVASVIGVHYLQNEERHIMREGPRRDDEKKKLKDEQLKQNKLELQYQQDLQAELEKKQKVRSTSDH